MVRDLLLYFVIVGLCGAIFLLLHVMVIRAMRGDKLIRTLAACIALLGSRRSGHQLVGTGR